MLIGKNSVNEIFLNLRKWNAGWRKCKTMKETTIHKPKEQFCEHLQITVRTLTKFIYYI